MEANVSPPSAQTAFAVTVLATVRAKAVAAPEPVLSFGTRKIQGAVMTSTAAMIAQERLVRATLRVIASQVVGPCVTPRAIAPAVCSAWITSAATQHAMDHARLAAIHEQGWRLERVAQL